MPVHTVRVPIQTPMYDAEGRMTRTWILFFERLPHLALDATPPQKRDHKATFGLVKALTVEDDLTNHFICRVGGKFYDLILDAKTAPVGANARFEIEISKDNGDIWTNIFADPFYVELLDGETHGEWDKTVFSTDKTVNIIAPGDLLRINCIQIGSTTPGQFLEFVLRWA